MNPVEEMQVLDKEGNQVLLMKFDNASWEDLELSFDDERYDLLINGIESKEYIIKKNGSLY